MGKPVNVISFDDWVREFLNSSTNLPNTVWATYWNGKRNVWKAIQIEYESGTQKATEMEAYFLTGNDEMLKDIKGINTVVSAEDLAKKPLQTLKAIGQKTLDDIGNMEEAAADRMSQTIGALTKGQLARPDKDKYDNPDSAILWVAKKMGIGITSTDGVIEIAGGKPRSRIQMIGSPTIAGAQADEDRYIAEEEASGNKLGKHKSTYARIKAYKSLAASTGGMVGQIDSRAARASYYKKTLIDHSRATAQELGVDINYATLHKEYNRLAPVGSGIAPSKYQGGIYSELASQSRTLSPVDNINDLLANDARICRALNIDPKVWASYSPKAQKFLTGYIYQEIVNDSSYATLGLFDPKSLLSKYGQNLSSADPKFITRVVENEKLRAGVENQLLVQTSLSELKQDALNAISVIEETKTVAEWNKIHGTGYTTLDEFSVNAKVSALDVKAQRDRIKDQARRSWNRMEDSTRLATLGQRMYFYGAVTDLIESIESGGFIKTAFIATRMFGMLPLLSPEVGPLSDFTKFIDYYISKADPYIEKAKKLVIEDTGLAFEGDISKLSPNNPLSIIGKRLVIESGTWVDWTEEVTHTRTGKKKKLSYSSYVKAKDAKGLFGEFSAFDITNKIFLENATLFDDIAGLKGWGGYLNSASDLFLINPLDPTKLNIEVLMNELNAVATAGIKPGTSAIHDLAHFLGLDNPDNLKKLQEQRDAMAKYGHKFLVDQLGAKGLKANGRWNLLLNIKQQNKIGHFLNSHMGLLNAYNRWANGLNTFFYKQIVWGQYAGNNLLIKAFMELTKPVNALMRSAGFADGMGLMEWVEKRFTGNISKFFEKLAADPSKILGKFASNKLISGTAGRLLGSVLVRSFSLIAANATAVVTAGLSYVLATFSDLLFSVGTNILKFKFGRILPEAKEILIKKLNTIKKITFGLIACGCLFLLSPVLLIVVIVGTALAPLENMGGGYGNSLPNESQMLKVTKTATRQNGTDVIKYKVTVESIAKDVNNSPVAVQISAVRETILYTGECLADGSPPASYSFSSPDGGVYGKVYVGNENRLIKLEDFPAQIEPNAPFVIEYELRGIIDDKDGTYVNNIEIDAKDEVGRNAFGSASINIGKGGCITCPAEWPATGSITQGPGGSASHTVNGAKQESLDIANGVDTKIYATHLGTVKAIPESSTCEPIKTNWLGAGCDTSPTASQCESLNTQMFKECGYGNHVRLTSLNNEYTSIYAHLVNFAVTDGATVQPGDLIGYMGTSGYSTGVHLHYQFVSKSSYYICNGSQPLIMATPYIPEDVPACVGASDCNMSVDTIYD